MLNVEHNINFPLKHFSGSLRKFLGKKGRGNMGKGKIINAVELEFKSLSKPSHDGFITG